MTTTLSSQFIGQSLHFGVNLFAALACIAAAWLYLDAWTERHRMRELAKGGGFILLTISFLLTGAAWGTPGLLNLTAESLGILGYLCLLGANLSDPVLPHPKIPGYTPSPAIAMGTTGTTISLAAGFNIALSAASFLIFLLYWRLATTGMERHLKPIAVAFGIFALAHALSLTSIWQTSSNPLLQPLGAPLGLFWILEHIMLLLGAAVLARWVWRYLAKRLLTQLFLTITTLTFAIVLVATVSISALLLSSLQHDSLSSLETATKVLSYAIDSKTADTRTDAEVLAQNPGVVTATAAHDHNTLGTLTSALLVQKQLSDVIVTDDSGVILVRASDIQRYGDSLSNNVLVQRALIGTIASSLESHTGALSPTLVITTASPIISGGQVVGVSLASLGLDNPFVDGIKHKTGLDSTVYSGATRAATTLTGTDGLSRSVGVKETNAAVLDQTLSRGHDWQGLVDVSGRSYLAVYLPLSDINNSVVGMLSVGRPQDAVLQSTRAAINLTFMMAAASLIVIMVLVYGVARQIARQLH